MKTEIKTVAAEFLPVELKITFDSERELDYFMALIGGNTRRELDYVNETIADRRQMTKSFSEILFPKYMGLHTELSKFKTQPYETHEKLSIEPLTP